MLIQPRDAREASDVFYRQRLGDVLLTYENEVVLTNQVGTFGHLSSHVSHLQGTKHMPNVYVATEDTTTFEVFWRSMVPAVLHRD